MTESLAMKTQYSLLLAGAAFAAVTASAVPVYQSGFETPGVGWTSYVNGSAAVTGWNVVNDADGEKTFLANKNRYNGVLDNNGNAINLFENQGLLMNEGTDITTTVPLVAGQKYTFSIWGYRNAKATKGLEIEIGSVAQLLTFDTWQEGWLKERTFTFIAGESDPTLKITNPNFDTAGYYQHMIDNITITAAVPDGGASAIMLGMGVLGLAMFRRRNS